MAVFLREHPGNSRSEGVAARVLEQAITSAAHCRFGKAGLGYIGRIWGAGMGVSGGTTPEEGSEGV